MQCTELPGRAKTMPEQIIRRVGIPENTESPRAEMERACWSSTPGGARTSQHRTPYDCRRRRG